MADIGYTIAAKLIEVLASESINEICKLWKYNSQLDKLKQTVSTIQQVFLDADSKWDHLSNQDRDFIRKLKDVVYDAEDVFDEFRTRAELQQLAKRSMVRKFFGKLRSIFSSKVYHAYRVYYDVKDIKERLDTIANEHKLFELKFDDKPIVRRSEETCSKIDATKIIGRDNDKESIINMLLDDNAQEVAIVGMGGLGKTALAQLVFNDERVKEKFLVRLWVCVSDQEGRDFDVKVILCKILELVNGEKVDGTSSLEFVQNQFEKIVRGEYFLVLDDVWNEDRVKWDKLKELLSVDHGGSKIMVTTRSEDTARIIGNKHVYLLHGLSEEDSQWLFELSAFGEGEKNNEFVEIGEKILGKCHRNPLAIKVIGSLVFGQNLHKWESIEKSGLAEISEGSDKIMPILKLSFHKLTPLLKSCFSYCAIFPKDLDMEKDMLLDLWMSQGYIVPFDGGQSLEEAAEEYFLILMRRCFFQDVKKDEYGNVVSVKIHDLMHDVAQEVGKDEICVVTTRETNLGKKIRHVNITSGKCTKHLLGGGKIRSYISSDKEDCMWDELVNNLRVVRVLQLSYSHINTTLPHSIDKLLLLRYLYLSNDNLLVVSNSITKLYNLEILVLKCNKLRELPIDFCKLVKLRHLNVSKCRELNDMPIGMNKLTKLRVLPFFVAGGNLDNGLQMLQVLTKIKGNMNIKVRNNYRDAGWVNDDKEGYLRSLEHLIKLHVDFETKGSCGNPEVVLKKLEPPLKLKELKLYHYKGTIIPWSAFSQNHQCVHISINDCPKLERIPMLSKLPNLKSLKLWQLDSVEYMEDEMRIMSNNDAKAIEVVDLFPSLEYLEMFEMRKFKRWWKGDLSGVRLRFPCLSYLEIECPNFTSFAASSNPPKHEFPCLRKLELRECLSLVSIFICPILEDVNIDKVGYLNSLTTNCLVRLKVYKDNKVESMLEVEETFLRSASTLSTLFISHCENLSTLSGLEHLTVLEELKLYCNNKLSIHEEDEEPWKSLHQTLRELEFSYLPEMKGLPKGIRHLTSLRSLLIADCKGIKSLPDGINHLTSLKKLYISGCPDLEERCKKPNGEDFHKIQHIPEIIIVIFSG